MVKKLADVSNQGSLGSLVRPPSPSRGKKQADQKTLRQREQRANLTGFGGSFLSTEPFDLQKTSNWGGNTAPDLNVTRAQPIIKTTSAQNIPSNTQSMPENATGSFKNMAPMNPSGEIEGFGGDLGKPAKLPKSGGRHRKTEMAGASGPQRGLLRSVSRGLEFYHAVTRHSEGRNAQILKSFESNGS